MLDEGHTTKAPAKVLLQGGPGAGKSVLLKNMACQWAKGEIWPDTKYVFSVNLKDFASNDEWSLSELLLGDLKLSESDQAVCFQEILAHPERIVILIDSIDEFSGFEYSPRRVMVKGKEVEMSTLVSAIIGDKVLPGARLVVATRQSNNSFVNAFDHRVQVSGFTSRSMDDYIHKFADSVEEEAFFRRNIAENQSMQDFSKSPLQCSILCKCLQDMYANARDGKSLMLNTTTDLYVQVTLQTASKAHPRWKYSTEETELEHLYGVIEEPLRKHACLALFGIMSSKVFFARKDLDAFGFSKDDINCGFLTQTKARDKRMIEAVESWWTFTHATMLQFFGALGVLGAEEGEWERLQKSASDEQLKTMICFLAGLLGDPKHTHYVDCLMPGGRALDVRKMITQVTGSLKDDAVTLSAVFETQTDDMVDIIGPEIESSHMSSMDVRALEWVLANEKYCITSLKLELCAIGPDGMMALAKALSHCPKVEQFGLTGNALSEPEAARALAVAIEKMTSLYYFVLQLCGIGPDGMMALAKALSHCPKVEQLGLTGNALSEPEAVRALAVAMEQIKSLRVLGLDLCGITPDGMMALTKALSHCPKVEQLGLSVNALSEPQAASALAVAIEQMTSLQHLSLGSCAIGPGGMVAVAKALSCCPNVIVLGLNGNALSEPEAARALTVAIEQMTSLQLLALGSCNIEADGIRAIRAACLHCPNVTILELPDPETADQTVASQQGQEPQDDGDPPCSQEKHETSSVKGLPDDACDPETTDQTVTSQQGQVSQDDGDPHCSQEKHETSSVKWLPDDSSGSGNKESPVDSQSGLEQKEGNGPHPGHEHTKQKKKPSCLCTII